MFNLPRRSRGTLLVVALTLGSAPVQGAPRVLSRDPQGVARGRGITPGRLEISKGAQIVARGRGGLAAAVEAAERHPSLPRLNVAHSHMRQVMMGLDTYFHGPTPVNPEEREQFAALRIEIGKLLAGPAPLIRVRSDTFQFDPVLHRRLAAVAAKLQRPRLVVEHLRAAMVGGEPQPADLDALGAAYKSLGDRVGLADVEAERVRLKVPAKASGAP